MREVVTKRQKKKKKNQMDAPTAIFKKQPNKRNKNVISFKHKNRLCVVFWNKTNKNKSVKGF